MKKFLVIMGSPRKGNTFQACEDLHVKIEKKIPVEFKYLWLKDANLLPCKGCFSCFSKKETTCPNRDDAQLIEKKMLEADCIIFAFPVYVMNVPALMKNFMDRFGYFGHRPRFFDKKAVILANTGAGGLNDVLKYMNKILRVWSFEIVSKIGLLAPPDPVTLNPSRIQNSDRILSKAAYSIVKSLGRRRKSPALYEVGFFHAWRAMSSMLKKYYPYDYQYWKENGWFEKGLKYYVDIPVNPFYVVLGKFVGWIMAVFNRNEAQNSIKVLNKNIK